MENGNENMRALWKQTTKQMIFIFDSFC